MPKYEKTDKLIKDISKDDCVDIGGALYETVGVETNDYDQKILHLSLIAVKNAQKEKPNGAAMLIISPEVLITTLK